MRDELSLGRLDERLDGWVEQLIALPGRNDAIEAAFEVTMSDGLCVIGARETIQTHTATNYLEEFGELPAAAAILAMEKEACACLSRRRYPRYPLHVYGALRASCAGKYVLIGVKTGKTAGIGHFNPIRVRHV